MDSPVGWVGTESGLPGGKEIWSTGGTDGTAKDSEVWKHFIATGEQDLHGFEGEGEDEVRAHMCSLASHVHAHTLVWCMCTRLCVCVCVAL